MKKVSIFELVDHGIEHFQYFHCYRRFSGDYENVVTGIGNSPAEAIDDCLNQIAELDFDIEGMEERIKESEEWDEFPTMPDIQSQCGNCDYIWYYVSILWNKE